jgi:hypothetical protein
MMKPTDPSFAFVLQKCMNRPQFSVSPGLLAKFSGVPKSTIVNWLQGTVSRPRRWQDVLSVADALRLDLAEVDDLLTSSQHPTAVELWDISDSIDRARFDLWLARANTLPTQTTQTTQPVRSLTS